MSQDTDPDPDGSDDGNERISPSVQMSNEIKDHQEEGRKRMKDQVERSADHESKSQRFHVFSPSPLFLHLLPSPPPLIHKTRTQNPSIITCHWNHCVISILIIVVYVIGERCVLSFPQGAPAESCSNLEPRHFGTKAVSSSSDYYLTASSSKFGVNFGFSKSGGVKGVFFLSFFFLLSSRPLYTVVLMIKHLKYTRFKMISQEAEERLKRK